MAHHTSLIVEDYSGDTLSVESYDKSTSEMSEPVMVRLKTESNAIVMLTIDDALALANWLADWVGSVEQARLTGTSS